ncbi:alpha/beta fold hydrolase [Curtobacterium sp. VKM Ac-2922]|uniref:alpha/beta fold hydrolase n=1 Tax=Curtobacterium sp. VKM Ac-2922 TaxID=2929475 RepID=UPI001FB3617A|nr:alpha/beta hydrolase [Curtobacterium sp. VKM Ac-2922]MCJ1713628.1 alpha/beta hydrolase [Curtobacterium sp. VKM Ac-2922]
MSIEPCVRSDGAARVETAVRGAGVPVLVLHGSPGGIDAAMVMSRFLPEDRFRTVLVSRPGYLGTALDPEHASIDDEADLLAGVLDDLGIERVGVLAWSGGGPVAYRLAVRHPDRVSAVVAASAVSGRWVPGRTGPVEYLVSHTAIGARLAGWAARHLPHAAVGGAITGVSSLHGRSLRRHVQGILGDTERRAFMLDMAATGNSSGAHRAGWRNDVRTFGAIESLELDRIGAPVLVVHGDADTEVVVSHSVRAAQQIPGAELVLLSGGTHFAFWSHREATDVQARAQEFLAASL